MVCFYTHLPATLINITRKFFNKLLNGNKCISMKYNISAIKPFSEPTLKKLGISSLKLDFYRNVSAI